MMHRTNKTAWRPPSLIGCVVGFGAIGAGTGAVGLMIAGLRVRVVAPNATLAWDGNQGRAEGLATLGTLVGLVSGGLVGAWQAHRRRRADA